MADAFLVKEFESELFYIFTYIIVPTYCYLVTLKYAIHAKPITITPEDIELIDSLNVMNGRKSYNLNAYATYTRKMIDSITSKQGNKQYCLL
jgi:hypothetical protein